MSISQIISPLKLRTKNLPVILSFAFLTSITSQVKVSQAEISQTENLENNIKIVDCSKSTVFESTLAKGTSKTNLIISEVNTNNFKITNNNLKRKAKKDGSSAVIEDVTTGTWVLCNKNLNYSSISLSTKKVASNKVAYLAGTGALVGGVAAFSLSGGSDNDSNRGISVTADEETNTSTASPETTSEDLSNNQGLGNDPQDNLLLPDDSCSKTSLRSSRANTRCGGAPDSLPTSAFD